MLRRTRRPRPRSRLLAAASVVVAVLVLLPDRLGLDRWLPFAVFSAMRPALVVAAAVGLVGVAVALVVRRGERSDGGWDRGERSDGGWDRGERSDGGWDRGERSDGRWDRSRASSVGAVALVAVVLVVAAVPVLARTVPETAPPPGGRDLTVLAFNVYEGRADPDALAAAIERTSPDLVVLPEAGERYRALMAERLPRYRSWTNVPPQAEDVRGIVVLAAPRAGDIRPVRLAEGTRYPWVDVTGGILGATRLVGVHLVSIVPEWIAYWPGELDSLQRWCSAGGSTLVVGDFNATPDHGPFRSGTAGCADAATGRGVSLGATWSTVTPRWLGAQIDHVLARGGPAAREVSVLDLPGSDHRALLARMRLPARG